MILINFGIQDGEHQYQQWDYDINFSKSDYDNGNVKDFDLLHDMYLVDKDDSNGDNSYWSNGRLVWIESVQDIDQKNLNILRGYV
tara:strand:+ start:60 stop:314 length:255 start_codon:yes stop_codon:yes gene_type:complete